MKASQQTEDQTTVVPDVAIFKIKQEMDNTITESIPLEQIPDNIPPRQRGMCGCFNWSKRTTFWLSVVILAAGMLRWLYVEKIETPPFSDMADYETVALNYLEGNGLIMSDLYRAYRPPFYPLFIAGIYSISGESPDHVRIAQIALSLATIVLIYHAFFWLLMLPPKQPRQPSASCTADRDKRISFARKVALASAVLFAFEETSVFFCGQLLTETLFVFLIMAWFFLLVRYVTHPSLGMATLGGLLAGCAILTRPLFALVFVIGVLWYYRQSLRFYGTPPRSWRDFRVIESPLAPPLLMILYAAVVVSCWTYRNYLVTGNFVPVSTNGGVNFYIGHNQYFGIKSFGNKEGIRNHLRSQGLNDEVLESHFFKMVAWDFIRNNPGEDFRNTLTKFYNLYLAPSTIKNALLPWRWWSYLHSPYRPWPSKSYDRDIRFWRVFNEDGSERMPAWRGWFWQEGRLPLVFWGWPIIFLVSGGMVLAIYRKERVGLPLLLIVVYTLALMVYFTNARFRFPLLPWLYFFAGYSLVVIGQSLSNRGKTTSTSQPQENHFE